MDIREYRYIYEIARQGGLSGASKVLYVSQPSLSEYLKNIEKRLGVQLFEHGSGRLRPTAAGEIYLARAGEILGIDQGLMEQLEDMKSRRMGRVRIGVSSTRSGYILPGLLPLYQQQYPGIEVRFQEATSRELEELAARREVDFVITNLPFHRQELNVKVLVEEETVIAVPDSLCHALHPQMKEGCSYPWIDVREMGDIPFTVLKPGQRLRQIAENCFAVMEKPPRILFETQSAQTAFKMAASGLCACLIYDTYCLVHPTDQVRLFCFGEARLPHQLVLAWPVKAVLSEPVQAVMELTESYLTGYLTRTMQKLHADNGRKDDIG